MSNPVAEALTTPQRPATVLAPDPKGTLCLKNGTVQNNDSFVPDTRYSSDLSPLSEKLYQVWAFIRPHSQMIYIMYVFRFFLECELYGLNELRRGSRRLSRTCIHTYQVHTYTHR